MPESSNPKHVILTTNFAFGLFGVYLYGISTSLGGVPDTELEVRIGRMVNENEMVAWIAEFERDGAEYRVGWKTEPRVEFEGGHVVEGAPDGFPGTRALASERGEISGG